MLNEPPNTPTAAKNQQRAEDVFTIPAQETAAWLEKKEASTKNLNAMIERATPIDSINAFKKFQFASRLFDQELRRFDFDETPRRLACFLASYSLHCSRLVAVIPRQTVITTLTGISKSHVSEGLTWLVNRNVFVCHKEEILRGNKIYKQSLWEPILDSGRWKVKELYPLTRDVLITIGHLYNPDEQFDWFLDKAPSLHEILQTLCLGDAGKAIENLPGNDPIRWGVPGANKRSGAGDVPEPPARPVAATVPHQEVNRDPSSDGRLGGGSASRHCDAPGDVGNGESQKNAWQRAAQKLRSFRENVLGKNVPSGGTNETENVDSGEQGASDLEKSSVRRNFSENQFPREEHRLEKVPAEKSSLDDAKSASGAATAFDGNEFPSRARETVVQFKQCTDNSSIKLCAGHDLNSQTSGEGQAGAPGLRWRNNPSPVEKKLLEKISEAVGSADVAQWQVMWLNKWIRVYPHVVIEWAVEETLLRLKEHGTGYFKYSPAAYLKATIKAGGKALHKARAAADKL